jgi:hypothetical protein
MEPLDERETAHLELEKIGQETLDRIAQSGARQSDVEFIAALAGIKWEKRA